MRAWPGELPHTVPRLLTSREVPTDPDASNGCGVRKDSMQSSEARGWAHPLGSPLVDSGSSGGKKAYARRGYDSLNNRCLWAQSATLRTVKQTIDDA
jgi:hypothetical protein